MRMHEQTGKQVIEATLRQLAKFPQVEHVVDGDVLRIKGAPDGFDIEVHDDHVEATIYAGPWHGHASDPEEAALFIVWMLSPRAKVVTHFRGKHQVRSAVELKHLDGRWLEHEVAGFLAPPFGKKTIETLSNNVISAEQVPMKP